MARERVEVVAYSGYRGEETPRAFRWQGRMVEVAEIESRWTEEGVEGGATRRGFRLTGTDGIPYLLIYDEQTQEWYCASKEHGP